MPSFRFLNAVRAGLVLGSLSLVCARPARAETPSVPHPHAYGIIVGSNTGGPGQQPLRYAEDDARRMAEVLRDLGRFGTIDLRVLAHPDGPQILATIDEIGQKLIAHQQRGEQAVVVFYYSGHAKANAFSLGDSELPLATLQGRLRQLPSTLTLVVIDACQSGAFARTKGAEPAADFSFNSVSRLTTKGIAVMASSTGQELSQESDELKSSYFTHHLVVALRGAGDADGDGRVSLDEAYRYAYRRTLSATARTRVGSQHATLETDLSGQGEVPVTYPADARSQLELSAPLEARVLVQHAASGGVVAELQKAPGLPLKIALPAGAYDATLRMKGRVMSCHLALADDRVTPIDLGACNVVAATGLAKGDDDMDGEPAADAPPSVPAPPGLREIDRWGVESSLGFIGATKHDEYTSRLGDFGYERDKGLIDLPSPRLALAVTRILIPHLALVLQAESLTGDSFSRSVAGDVDKFAFRGYGGGIYLRVSTDIWPRIFQIYGQAGGGASVAFTSLSTKDERGPFTAKETSWGALYGLAGGIALLPGARASAYAQFSYDRAVAMTNLLDETHDVGGPAFSLGCRIRFGELPR